VTHRSYGEKGVHPPLFPHGQLPHPAIVEMMVIVMMMRRRWPSIWHLVGRDGRLCREGVVGTQGRKKWPSLGTAERVGVIQEMIRGRYPGPIWPAIEFC